MLGFSLMEIVDSAAKIVLALPNKTRESTRRRPGGQVLRVPVGGPASPEVAAGRQQEAGAG